LKAKEERQFAHNTSARIAQILDSTLKAESANFNAVNNGVIKRTLQALDDSIQSPRVQEGCLKQALLQLKNLKSKGANLGKDPLTEVVVDTLRAEAQKFERLNEAEKNKLFVLSDAQKEAIKAQDKNLKES